MELLTGNVGENPEPGRVLTKDLWWIPAHLPTSEEAITQRFSEPGIKVKVEYTRHDGIRVNVPIDSRDPKEVSKDEQLMLDRQKLTSSIYRI